ncbi:hypothetical protein IV203_026074 [Nitzschia inconspicua]|uniref:Uncharacterized protein n=1 Tax=Nitzschia inconspicua TaxID=303405 RepID=A0A9K3PZJ1_9STRA|nr:hypothetical protein IV203_026074 [Nitzschia inconspicua]
MSMEASNSRSERSDRSTGSKPLLRSSSDVHLKPKNHLVSHHRSFHTRMPNFISASSNKNRKKKSSHEKTKSRSSHQHSPPEILAFGAVLDHLVKGGNLKEANRVYKKEFQLINSRNSTPDKTIAHLGKQHNSHAHVSLTAEQQLAKQHQRRPVFGDEEDDIFSSFSGDDYTETIYEDDTRFMEESRFTEDDTTRFMEESDFTEDDTRFLEDDTRFLEDDTGILDDDHGDEEEGEDGGSGGDEEDEESDVSTPILPVASAEKTEDKDFVLDQHQGNNCECKIIPASGLSRDGVENTCPSEKKEVLSKVEPLPVTKSRTPPLPQNRSTGFPVRSSSLKEHYAASRSRLIQVNSDKEGSVASNDRSTSKGNDAVKENILALQEPKSEGESLCREILDTLLEMETVIPALKNPDDSIPGENAVVKASQRDDIMKDATSSSSRKVPASTSKMRQIEGAKDDSSETTEGPQSVTFNEVQNQTTFGSSKSVPEPPDGSRCSNAEMFMVDEAAVLAVSEGDEKVRTETGSSNPGYTSFIKQEDGTLAAVEEKPKGEKRHAIISFFKKMNSKGAASKNLGENTPSIREAVQNAEEETLDDSANARFTSNASADATYLDRSALGGIETDCIATTNHPPTEQSDVPTDVTSGDCFENKDLKKREIESSSGCSGKVDVIQKETELLKGNSVEDEAVEAKNFYPDVMDKDTPCVSPELPGKKTRKLPFSIPSLSLKKFSSKRKNKTKSDLSLVLTPASIINSTTKKIEVEPGASGGADIPVRSPSVEDIIGETIETATKPIATTSDLDKTQSETLNELLMEGAKSTKVVRDEISNTGTEKDNALDDNAKQIITSPSAFQTSAFASLLGRGNETLEGEEEVKSLSGELFPQLRVSYSCSSMTDFGASICGMERHGDHRTQKKSTKDSLEVKTTDILVEQPKTARPRYIHDDNGFDGSLEANLNVDGEVQLLEHTGRDLEASIKIIHRAETFQNVGQELLYAKSIESEKTDITKDAGAIETRTEQPPPFNRVDTFQNIGQELLYIESLQPQKEPKGRRTRSKHSSKKSKQCFDTDKPQAKEGHGQNEARQAGSTQKVSKELSANEQWPTSDSVVWGSFLGLNIRKKKRTSSMQKNLEMIPESGLGEEQVFEPLSVSQEHVTGMIPTTQRQPTDFSVSNDNYASEGGRWSDGLTGILVECAKVQSEVQLCNVVDWDTVLELFPGKKDGTRVPEGITNTSRDQDVAPRADSIIDMNRMIESHVNEECTKNIRRNIWESMFSLDLFHSKCIDAQISIDTYLPKKSSDLSQKSECRSSKQVDPTLGTSDGAQNNSFQAPKSSLASLMECRLEASTPAAASTAKESDQNGEREPPPEDIGQTKNSVAVCQEVEDFEQNTHEKLGAIEIQQCSQKSVETTLSAGKATDRSSAEATKQVARQTRNSFWNRMAGEKRPGTPRRKRDDPKHFLKKQQQRQTIPTSREEIIVEVGKDMASE